MSQQPTRKLTLVGVDWGTSSLRAARLAPDGEVLEERHADRGILTVPPGGFPAVLQALCGDWIAGAASRVLVCGMAGSRQGWIEAPYCPCPATEEDLARGFAWVEPGRVAIVPGASCENDGVPDVMRGEETQVVGALEVTGLADAQLVLPGTHSKWVDVQARRITGFRTFMTGEFYGLLRQHSILARTMTEHDHDAVLDEPMFVRGLEQARHAGSLLHAAFSARTLSLFDRLPAERAASYLSGLVIGEELRAVQPQGRVVIVGNAGLSARYELALRHAGCDPVAAGERCTWHGLARLARHMETA